MNMLANIRREPLAIIAAVEAVLAFALTLTSLDTNTQGAIMAAAVAVGGLWGAWVTQDTMLGAVTTVIKTGAVLVATFHYSFSDTSQATLIAAAAVIVGLFYQRQQTSPAVAQPVLSAAKRGPNGRYVAGE